MTKHKAEFQPGDAVVYFTSDNRAFTGKVVKQCGDYDWYTVAREHSKTLDITPARDITLATQAVAARLHGDVFAKLLAEAIDASDAAKRYLITGEEI